MESTSEASLARDAASGLSNDDLIEYHLARQNAAQSYNADMAKWILASLLLINGGPFLMIGKESGARYFNALNASASWLVVGLALAVLCGFAAWLNTGMREAVGGYIVKRLTAGGGVAGRGEIISVEMVKISYGLSILTGFGSLAMFLIGALQLSCTLSNAPVPTPTTQTFAISVQPR